MGLLLSLLLAQAVTPTQLRAARDIAQPVGTPKTADGGYALAVMQDQWTPPTTGAFGAALGVQETIPLSLSFPYNIIDPYAVTIVTDAGSVTADGGHAILTVGTTGYSEFRSKLSARYVPGQGLSARFTFVADKPCNSGQEFEIGAGDSVDGFFFGCCPSCETDGGPTFGVLRKSSSVDNWTPASRFNGPWGTTPPDVRYGRPYQIAWQWLGYGQITYSIEDELTGSFKVAHSIRYAGTATETSVANATLPLHAHILNTASDAGLVVRVPSMAIIRQGAEPVSGRRFSYTGTRATSTTETQLLAIRNDTAFNGRVNRSGIRVDFISWNITASGTGDVIIRLRLNPVQAGTGFAGVDPYSIASYDLDGGFVSNGRQWIVSTAENGGAGAIDLRPYEILMAPGDVLIATGQATTGTPAALVSLSWVEEL